MALRNYSSVDSANSLVAGYWTLMLQVRFTGLDELVNLNLASTRAPFHIARVAAALQIDVEPYRAETVQMFYKWDLATYSSLRSILVRPGSFPRRGRLLWSHGASLHAMRSGYSVEAYTVISYGPGPLATKIPAA